MVVGCSLRVSGRIYLRRRRDIYQRIGLLNFDRSPHNEFGWRISHVQELSGFGNRVGCVAVGNMVGYRF